jgi:aminopeptidase N
MRYISIVILLFCGLIEIKAQNQVDPYCHKAAFMPFSHSWISVDDPNYDIKHHEIHWTINPNVLAINGSVSTSCIITANNVSQILVDLSSALMVSSIKSDTLNLLFEHNNSDLITIQLPRVYNKDESFRFTINYGGTPTSSGLGSFNKGTHANQPVIWNVSPPFGSRDFWPCKNGLTDKIDSLDIYITSPSKYKGASNGLLISEYIDGDNYTCHWKHKYPIASYLVGVAVTNFAVYNDTVTLQTGKIVPIVNYVYPEGLTAAKSGTKELVKTLAFFDSLFVDYPFANEKYGHAQFGFGGGMEHQTMSFVTNFGFGLLAHELAHQWVGDQVTCNSWTDTWLNEGAATYFEGLAQERFKPTGFITWKISKRNNITSMPSGSVKVPETQSASRIFDGRLTYNKGAYLFHMLRWLIGDPLFFEGMSNYLDDRAYGFAATSDLQHHMEKVSGKDLDEFFADWYVGEGHPEYVVTWFQIDQKLYVKIDQKSSHPSVSFFEMPVPLRLTTSDGAKTFIRLDHTHSGQIFEIDAPLIVNTIDFDPLVWILAKGSVKKEIFSSTEDNQSSIWSLGPNPFDVTLSVNNAPETIFIYDSKGKLVLSSQTQTGSIDVSALIPGMYSICSGDGCKVVIKQ